MRPQLHPMCPQLHDPSLSSPGADVPMSPSSPTTEEQAPGQMDLAIGIGQQEMRNTHRL